MIIIVFIASLAQILNDNLSLSPCFDKDSHSSDQFQFYGKMGIGLVDEQAIRHVEQGIALPDIIQPVARLFQWGQLGSVRIADDYVKIVAGGDADP